MKLKHVKKRKRQLAVILTLALTANTWEGGMFTSWADSGDEARWSIEEVADLPEEVLNQQVSLGMTEDQLNLPEYLEVIAEQQDSEEDSVPAQKSGAGKATDSDAKATDSEWGEKATDSNSQEDSWEMVPVTWSLLRADNGQTVYDGEVPGTYTFEAELADSNYKMGSALLPMVTVEVEEDQENAEYVREIVDLGTIETNASTSFFSLRDGQVDMIPGEHVRWIDQIQIPEEVMHLYEVLEEGADNDGVEDILIDDEYFSRDQAEVFEGSNFRDVFNGIEIMHFTRNSKWDDNERNYYYNCIAAAFQAFDRDHPEVFWLEGGKQGLFDL